MLSLQVAIVTTGHLLDVRRKRSNNRQQQHGKHSVDRKHIDTHNCNADGCWSHDHDSLIRHGIHGTRQHHNHNEDNNRNGGHDNNRGGMQPGA